MLQAIYLENNNGIIIRGQTKDMVVTYINKDTLTLQFEKGRYGVSNFATLGVGLTLTVLGAGLLGGSFWQEETYHYGEGDNKTYYGWDSRSGESLGISGSVLLAFGAVLDLAGVIPHYHNYYVQVIITSKTGEIQTQYISVKKGDNNIYTYISDIAMISLRQISKREYKLKRNTVVNIGQKSTLEEKQTKKEQNSPKKDKSYSQPPVKENIFRLVENGDLVKLEKLFSSKKSNENPNAKDVYGTPLIIIAVKNGYSEIVKLLITYHADIDAIDKNKKNALYYAQELKNKHLLNTIKFGMLLQAISSENVALVKQYIDEGINYNTRDNLRRNCLHYVSQNGNTEIAKILLDSGVNINSRDKDGNTPVMIASEKGMYDLVKFFIDNNADLRIENNKGKTALDIASKNNFKNIVSLIKS